MSLGARRSGDQRSNKMAKKPKKDTSPPAGFELGPANSVVDNDIAQGKLKNKQT